MPQYTQEFVVLIDKLSNITRQVDSLAFKNTLYCKINMQSVVSRILDSLDG